MQDKRLDFSRPVLPQRRTTEVSVLFTTTHEPAPQGAPERFTRRPGNAGSGGSRCYKGRRCGPDESNRGSEQPIYPARYCVSVARGRPTSVTPPSTTSVWPVMKRAWSDSRKRTA